MSVYVVPSRISRGNDDLAYAAVHLQAASHRLFAAQNDGDVQPEDIEGVLLEMGKAEAWLRGVHSPRPCLAEISARRRAPS